MERVVFLSDVRVRSRATWAGVISPHAGNVSGRDRAALDVWARDGRRCVSCFDELGTYVMLYEANRCWASWGIVWRSAGVLLWDCVTHEDIGTFPSAVAALAALGAGDDTDIGNVVPFEQREMSRRISL